MSTALQTFDFSGQAVRVLGTSEHPMFVATDVCNILHIENPSIIINGQDRTRKDGTVYRDGFTDDEKGIHIVNTPSGDQQMLCVTEPGLYRLIFKSRKPQAKAFQRWVCHEVLPQIRRQGFYMNTPLDFERHPVAEKFADLFTWLRSMDIGADAAADVARSLAIRETPAEFTRPSKRTPTKNAAVNFEPIYPASDLLDVMGGGEWTVVDLQRAVTRETGMSERNFYSILRRLRRSGEIERGTSYRLIRAGGSR